MNDEQRDSARPKMEVVHYDDDGLPGAVTRIAPGQRFTECGNAKRFAYQHGSKVRFVWPWNRWLIWDGKRWRIDDSGVIPTLAKRTVDSLCAEAGEFSDDQRREALRHAVRSESAAAMRGMLELARSEPGIPVSPDDLDSNPMLLNVQNGTVNLHTGMLRDHNQDDLISHLAEAELSDPKCPRWLAFLDKIFAGQQDLIDYLQRAVGYTLTGGTDEQCLFFLHGNGANGKSTFIGAVEHVLGSYALTTPADTLMATKRDNIPNDIARLKGIRMVIGQELDENRRLNESRIKTLTGGDTVTARFMRAEWFDFRPIFKLWIFGNHRPDIHGTDDAIWRRIHLIPFEVQIPPTERDPRLPEKLKHEAPGILAWAVEGCLRWQEQGLRPPDAVMAACSEYRAAMDVLGEFLQDCCETLRNSQVKASSLYRSYRAWAERTGETAISQRRFGIALSERGFQRKKTGGVKIYQGIALKNEELGNYEQD